MMQRPYYFGAGPAAIPTAVLESVQKELLDWEGSGVSILELGHRTKRFEGLMERLDSLFRSLAGIPPDYHVIWVGAPTRAHFAWIPQNFLTPKTTAGYWVTGHWSLVALQEAQKVERAYCIASTESGQFRDIPAQSDWHFQKNTGYVYLTPNETIHGVRFFPDLTSVASPIIADMTSCFLTEPVDVTAYGLIVAGAQKNLANAGLSVVVLSPSLFDSISNDTLPTLSDYRTYVNSRSLYTTPPTFNCYVMLKMLEWLQEQGGVPAIYEANQWKAKTLYDYIDNSGFYTNPIAPAARSMVNIPFTCVKPDLETVFLEAASRAGLLGLSGHRVVGGMRASLYNALPRSGVEALIRFMQAFAKEHA